MPRDPSSTRVICRAGSEYLLVSLFVDGRLVDRDRAIRAALRDGTALGRFKSLYEASVYKNGESDHGKPLPRPPAD